MPSGSRHVARNFSDPAGACVRAGRVHRCFGQQLRDRVLHSPEDLAGCIGAADEPDRGPGIADVVGEEPDAARLQSFGCRGRIRDVGRGSDPPHLEALGDVGRDHSGARAGNEDVGGHIEQGGGIGLGLEAGVVDEGIAVRGAELEEQFDVEPGRVVHAAVEASRATPPPTLPKPSRASVKPSREPMAASAAAITPNPVTRSSSGALTGCAFAIAASSMTARIESAKTSVVGRSPGKGSECPVPG